MRPLARVSALTITALAFAAPAALANPAASHPAQLKKVYSGSMTFTGALKGTLKVTPTAACTATSGHGVQMGDFHSKLSPSKATNWSVTVLVPHSGTFRTFKLGRTSFVLASGFKGWVATSGSITVSGTTGKVNLVLSAHEGGTTGVVHVQGWWNC